MSKKVIEEGKILYKQGKYKKAIKQFDKAIKKKPDDFEGWFLRGTSLFKYTNSSLKLMDPKKYEEAEMYIDKALELNLDNNKSAGMWITKSKIRNIIGPYEDALNCCIEAMKINPNKYWLDVAVTHDSFNHYQEALECLEKSIMSRSEVNPLLDKLKAAYLSGITYGNNFHTSVSDVLLLKVIPEPEIIYTSKMQIKWISHYTSGGGLNKPKEAHYAGCTTSVYITPKGFACFFPINPRPPLKFLPSFFTWQEARLPITSQIKIGKGDNTFTFRLTRIKFRESKNDFKLRKRNFKADIRDLRGFI